MDVDRLFSACVVAALVGLGSCGFDDSGPLSPESALHSFRVADGFRVELFATEPHVVDPVEIAFDERGGIYVAELLDNPDDPPSGSPPLSRIKYLEDSDGDGVVDRHTVFADQLLAVEGIAPWKGGLIATAAPDILYLKDLDGDRKADLREVLYTGFALGHVEGRLSNPRLGLDNWFYVVNHAYPGEVTAPKRPDDPPINVRNREFRFHPLRNLAEVSPGNAQFGQSYNQWGHWFISHNTVHLRHTVVPPGYLQRNPYLVVEGAEQDVSDHGRPAAPVFSISPPQQWRIDRTAARNRRYAETRPGRIEQLEGYFTASCGATVYLGDAFPEQFRGSVFVGEGAGNLVHCDLVTPDGATYAASRWPSDSEFLASTDNWFRPVNFANAPDGNLYVVDYYRQYLEHPDFIPDSVKRRLNMDFRAGDTLGRIYRIVPEASPGRRPLRIDLGSAPSRELVEFLTHPNGWHRRTAHRLLIERQDRAVVEPLQDLARKAAEPTVRLHAMWVLEGLGSLDADIVEEALADAHPAVREHALRLAEEHLDRLGSHVLAATEDESPRVAFQATLTAGNLIPSEPVIAALGRVLAKYPEDHWFRVAALSAPANFAMPLLSTITRETAIFEKSPSAPRRALLRDFARVISARHQTPEVSRLLALITTEGVLGDTAWKTAVLQGTADGLSLGRGSRLADGAAAERLQLLLTDDSEEVRAAAVALAPYVRLGDFVNRARVEALDENLGLERRILAVRALQGGAFDEVADALESILHGDAEIDLRSAAARALASFADSQVAGVLLAGWPKYSAAIRDIVAELLIRQRDRAAELADAILAGRIEPDDIPAITRIRFAQHPDAQLRARIAGRLKLDEGGRDAVVADHLGVLDLAGDPRSGKSVFERECSSCHLRRESRGRIGPDLAGVSNRSRESLLTSILDPSSAIEDRYRNHLLETIDGRFYDGILVAETEVSVTLRGEVEDVTVLKGDIAELRQSSVSLMPDGLEDAATDQELADLIAYLRAGL